MAGGIDISNAAYCWVKDVQTDATIGGMHVAMTGTYRCVVRDSYFHNSANYGFGQDCYGVVLRCGAAENLVENNIVRYMNKPILFNVSGGGNVIGYNYADNSWATPAAWQEVNIDCHCSFPHMELMQGNDAPHMARRRRTGMRGTSRTSGTTRRVSSPLPPCGDSTDAQTGNVTTLEFDGGDVGMNVLANVLGKDGVNMVYDAYDSGPFSIFELGNAGSGATDVATTTLLRHGNYEYVNHAVSWDPKTKSRDLPASFHLKGKPGWWPASTPWPWVGSDLAPHGRRLAGQGPVGPAAVAATAVLGGPDAAARPLRVRRARRLLRGRRRSRGALRAVDCVRPARARRQRLAPAEPVAPDSPRASVSRFLELCRAGEYAEAATYLDLADAQKRRGRGARAHA